MFNLGAHARIQLQSGVLSDFRRLDSSSPIIAQSFALCTDTFGWTSALTERRALTPRMIQAAVPCRGSGRVHATDELV
jgi:hypothetical protein